MTTKTGPAHIHIPQFDHPGKGLWIIQRLEDIPDFRKASPNFLHSLPAILLIIVVGVMTGATDFDEMVMRAEAWKGWLESLVEMPNGVPSSITLERALSLIDHKHLQGLLQEVGARITPKIIAIDGKEVRGAKEPTEGKKALHHLHAWAVQEGLCLAQVSVDKKSNEITAMPELLELLALEGCIVTADAMHTQTKTVAKIHQKKGHYCLPVKKNQSSLFEEVKTLLDAAVEAGFCGYDACQFETIEKGHGRIESRRYILVDASELPATEEWVGLTSVGLVIRDRTEKGKTSTERVYFITSLDLDAKLFASVVRGHWGVENGLHRSLDVFFKEDSCRFRQRQAAENLASIRRIVLNACSMEKTSKLSKPKKILKAFLDASYRLQLLKLCC